MKNSSDSPSCGSKTKNDLVIFPRIWYIAPAEICSHSKEETAMDRRTLGHLAALFTILNWGTTFIATKILLRSFTPAEILVFRFMLGVAALYIACPRLLRVGNWRRELCFVAAGLTGVCLYYLMENVALTYTTAANAGFIVTSSPLFTALFAWKAGMGEGRPSKRFFLGFITAMAGICLISFPSGAELALNWKGDLLCVGAAVVWGIYSLLVRHISTFGYNVLQTTRRTFIYGLLFMIPAAMNMDFRWDLTRLADPACLGTFLYLGIGACALCFVTWNIAVGRLGSVRTSVYLYLVPVITLICSVTILHEPLTTASFAGAALTLLGLVIS